MILPMWLCVPPYCTMILLQCTHHGQVPGQGQPQMMQTYSLFGQQFSSPPLQFMLLCNSSSLPVTIHSQKLFSEPLLGKQCGCSTTIISFDHILLIITAIVVISSLTFLSFLTLIDWIISNVIFFII